MCRKALARVGTPPVGLSTDPGWWACSQGRVEPAYGGLTPSTVSGLLRTVQAHCRSPGCVLLPIPAGRAEN